MKIKGMFFLSIILIILFGFSSIAFGIDTNYYKPTKASGFGEFSYLSNNFLGIIQFVGIILAVIVLALLGFKYMLGSIEEKAEYKKAMMPYILGCFLLVAAPTVVRIINNVVSGSNLGSEKNSVVSDNYKLFCSCGVEGWLRKEEVRNDPKRFHGTKCWSCGKKYWYDKRSGEFIKAEYKCWCPGNFVVDFNKVAETEGDYYYGRCSTCKKIHVVDTKFYEVTVHADDSCKDVRNDYCPFCDAKLWICETQCIYSEENGYKYFAKCENCKCEYHYDYKIPGFEWIERECPHCDYSLTENYLVSEEVGEEYRCLSCKQFYYVDDKGTAHTTLDFLF